MVARLARAGGHVKEGISRGAHALRRCLAAVRPPSLLLATALAAVSAVPSPAADLPPDEIVAVRIQGNDHVPERDIRNAMQLHPGTFLHSIAYDPDLLEADVVTITALYRSRGYLEAAVTGRAVVVNARTLPHQVALELAITEGTRTMVTETTFEGNTLFPALKLTESVRLKPPAAYDSLEVEPDVYRVQALYLDEGYLQASVTPVVRGGPGWRTINYRVTEGRRFRVGAIGVEGNGSTQPGVVTRELTLAPGDIFRRRAALASEQNIYDTGLFMRVDVVPQPRVGDGDSLDLVVRVRERRTRWLGGGVGYGTLDELRLSGEWGDRNLSGTARQLSTRALYATQIFPIEMQRVRFDLSFGVPRIMGSRSLLAVNPFFERRRDPYLVSSQSIGDYQLEVFGVTATLRRDFSKKERATLGLNQSWIRLREPTFTPSESDLEALGVDRRLRGQEASVSASYVHDTRDDFLNPRRGMLFRATAAIAAARPLGLNRPFAKVTLTSGRHRPLGREGALTTRFSVGAIVQVSHDAPVPDRERFKIGGESTLRGYPDRVIGPGNGMLTGSLEWLFPLPGTPRGLLFADGGGVWERRRDLRLSQFFSLSGEGAVRYSAGPGIWIPTPVGPLELGYGQRIGQHPVRSSGRLFVVFGQAF